MNVYSPTKMLAFEKCSYYGSWSLVLPVRVIHNYLNELRTFLLETHKVEMLLI